MSARFTAESIEADIAPIAAVVTDETAPMTAPPLNQLASPLTGPLNPATNALPTLVPDGMAFSMFDLKLLSGFELTLT